MNPFLLQFLSFTTQIIPVVFVLYYSKYVTKELLIVSYYLILLVAISSLNVYMALHKIHNLWTTNAFMPIEYGLLMWFFSNFLEQPRRRFAVWSIPLFFVVWTACFLFESITNLSTLARPIEGVLLTLVSCLVLGNLYTHDIVSFARKPVFWIASAAILYFGSTAILFAISGILLRESFGALRLALSAEAIVNIVANLLYAGGFLCLRLR